MLLMRVRLPDRPGSLGAVATAMGTVGVDILAVEIVERGPGYAVDDFILAAPGTTLADTIVSACAGIEGVRVLWVSRYHNDWGVESDIAALNRMVEQPDRAGEVLTEEAPVVFHSSWAMLVDTRDRRVVARSKIAPEIEGDELGVLGGLDDVYSLELDPDWLPGWGETLVAVAPLGDGRSIVIGRQGGPEYLRAELARLRHLAALAGG